MCRYDSNASVSESEGEEGDSEEEGKKKKVEKKPKKAPKEKKERKPRKEVRLTQGRNCTISLSHTKCWFSQVFPLTPKS